MHFRKAGASATWANCKSLPDTGTSRSIVHVKILQRAGIEFNPGGAEPISAANGSALTCMGNVLLEIKVDDRCVMIDALVTDTLHDSCLLSWKDLQRLGIVSKAFPNRPQATACSAAAGGKAEDTLASLIKEFADIFDESVITPMNGEPMQVHLNRADPAYKASRVNVSRRVPLHFQAEAEKTVKWFVDSGVLVKLPATEESEWCSAGFFVPKPSGALRLVVDYKPINFFILRPAHPFPSPRDVIRGILPTSKWF